MFYQKSIPGRINETCKIFMQVQLGISKLSQNQFFLAFSFKLIKPKGDGLHQSCIKWVLQRMGNQLKV